ncbi:MAG: hypothetical protein QOH58_3305 [Thermoleophilaceae bacterium]|jgi:uncharacterized protein (TIGR02271 family)|nr:hypothetical protein [Thermoleophilaceae bacterium]
MTQVTEAYEWRGREVVNGAGEKIGRLEDIYLDTDSGQPEWATVNTGMFGMRQSFVPLTESSSKRGQVVVPYSKDQVKDAPTVDPDGELSAEEEQSLRRHYGVGEGGAPVGEDVSGPTTDDAMTRSEEELRVGTSQRERGRARLRKYVVTEEVQQTVPVQREEVRVEREPITEGNVDQATAGPEISEEEHEVTLHEEEVVTEKRVVPKERVRMTKDTVTDEQTVSEEVRQERIDVEGDR